MNNEDTMRNNDAKTQSQEDNLESQPWKDPAHDQTHVDEDSEGEGGVSVEMGGRKIHVNEKQLPYVGMFITALVLLVALIVNERNEENYIYGIVVADVALFFSIFGTIHHYFYGPNRSDGNVGLVLAYFMFAWCFAGACVLTFRGPFEITGNGYFASWGMAIFGAMASGISSGISKGQVKSALSGFTGSILILLVCAVVIIVDTPREFDGIDGGESIYAFIVACLTALTVLFFFYERQYAGAEIDGHIVFFVFAAFAVLWVVLAFVVTFRGPFRRTGNGYFGAWAGAIVTVYAVKSAHHRD